MEIIAHHTESVSIAEITSEVVVISNPDDALDLIGNVSYQGFDNVIVHAKNITPEFFDLKTRLAGEVLQKFANYRMRVCLVGNYSALPGKSLQDFIRESNREKQVHFASSLEEALRFFSGLPR